ncbi:MAG: 30S ribosomal protein S3 [Chloroflexi bacterium]|nr:30S ribosomal protein S3 [Chloroflexota bacterium]MDA1218016.1 30S ribosomal protein S3 [Chloroflexota bacterium]PKB57318.1 MAG: 30S ribosomal protein S3 [SAR202 cluster bacterium Casp-Chloro-G3]
MGHKTHPLGFRLGIIKDWKTHWYANNASGYRNFVTEDLKLRKCVYDEYNGFADAGIAKVEIDRGAQDSVINIHSARPGILIGRDGERVKQLRTKLESITARRVQLNIIEIEQPELDPFLVGRSIADQLQRRVAYRRAMRQAGQRAMQAGAQGIKIIAKGRLSGAEIARTEKLMLGRVPLHTLRADIDYALAEAGTAMGRIGIKVWIYKGEILPPPPEAVEEMDTIEVRVQGGEEELETGTYVDDIVADDLP